MEVYIMAENRDIDLISRKNSKTEYLDSTSAYLKEIGKIPLLTPKEELKLAKTIKEGTIKEAKEARKKFLNSNLKLVVPIARFYAMLYNEPLLDIIQNGNLGLMRALEHYDYTLGFKFSTYATRWIKQAITRSHAENSRTIRLPVGLQLKYLEIKKAKAMFIAKNQREPTDKEVSELTGFSVKDIKKIQLHFLDIASLETPISEDEEIVLGDTIPDRSVKGSADYILEEIIDDAVIDALDEILNERECEVIKRRLGLIYGDSETLEEVSISLGVTKERIRQIEKKALKKIREYINADFDDSNIFRT